MITTAMEEQIAYAVNARPQFEYLRKKYEWTDNQLQAINWRGIGLAKKRLKRDASIRVSKMILELAPDCREGSYSLACS